MNKISKLLLSFFLVFTSFSYTPVLAEEVEETELTEEEQELVENLVIDEQGFIHVEEPVEEVIIDETLAEGVDFNSKRLLVAGDETLLEGMNVISEYNGLYLVQFETTEKAKEAYLTLLDKAEFVEPDVEVIATEGEPDIVSLEEPELTEDENPFVELENELAKEEVFEEIVDNKQIVVALLDTGVSENEHVFGRVSMLGTDANDDNGHGNRMLEYMIEENPEIKVLSVKVLDANGKGNISSVVAGMEYAIEQGVDIINLSLSARSTLENSALKDAVDKAVSLGIKVVGSAGNGGFNVMYTVPGSIESAIVVAALDEEGNYQPGSNFGATIDYGFIGVNTTSEATARFSALLALDNNVENVYANSKVIKPGEKNDDIEIPGDDEEFEMNFPVDIAQINCENVNEYISTFTRNAQRAGDAAGGEYLGHTAQEWMTARQQAIQYRANRCSTPEPTDPPVPTCSSNGVTNNGSYIASVSTGFYVARFRAVDGSGKELFCMDPYTLFNPCVENTGYYATSTGSLTKAQTIELAKILGAYLKTSRTDAHYLATQIKVWSVLGNNISITQYLTTNSGAYSSAVSDLNAIIGKQTTSIDTVYEVALNKSSLSMKVGDDAVNVTDTKNNLNGTYKGKFTIKNNNSSTLTVKNITNGFSVEVKDPYPLKKSVTVQAASSEMVESTTNYTFEYWAAMNTQRMASFGDFMNRVRTRSYVGDELVVNTPVGNLTINKVEEETNRPVTTPVFVTEDGERIGNVRMAFDLWFDDDSPYVGTSADSNTTITHEEKTLHRYKSHDGKVTWDVDSNGKVNITNIPVGTYYLRESVCTSDDDYFERSEKIVTVDITNGNTKTVKFENQSTVKITLIKTDIDTETQTQGDASVEGAVFTVYDTTKNNKKMGELTVKADGTTNIVEKLPRSHDYKLVETTVPEGYEKMDDIIITSEQLKRGINKQRIYTAEVSNTIKRGGVKIQKRDYETKEDTPQGDATFEGAYFKIINTSKDEIVLHTSEGDIKVAPGEVVPTVDGHKEVVVNAIKNIKDKYTIITNEKGLAELPSDYLPYGSYHVVEVKAPKGYTTKLGILERDFQIRESGVVVDMTSVDKSIQNVPIRGDFDLRKTSFAFGRPIEGVQFEVTLISTGETHIITTDKNGYYTSDSRENDIPHEYNTNQGGNGDGLWFGQEDQVKTYDANGDYVGALLYGEYLIKEIPGPNNEGYQMAEFTLDITKDEKLVSTSNVQNVQIPTIRTKAQSIDGTKMLAAIEEAFVVDIVTMDNLDPDKTYTLVTELMDQVTEEPALNAEGKPYIALKTFKPGSMFHEEEIEMTINATLLDGHDVVFFETLYEGSYDNLENLPKDPVSKHRDITDPEQTLDVPEIHTTATIDGLHVSPVMGSLTVKDVVEYADLQKGLRYTIEGTLHKVAYDEEGNKIDGGVVLNSDGSKVTARKSFRANSSEGKVELEFTVDNIKIGETYVAFEELWYNEELYAIHADITDEPQSVHFPKIRTKAQSDLGYKNVVTTENSVIIDTVIYEAVSPLHTYVIKGQVYDKTDEKLLDIFAETEFTPEGNKGEVEVKFEFDGTPYAKHDLVIFETLYVKTDGEPKEITDHKDPEDPEQTVYMEVPEDEKYVNKVVHEELASFQETFTYDIMGYITHDAESVEFTDELVEELTFASEEIKVSVHADNDHKPNGTVATEGETLKEFTTTIEGQLLTVIIPDAKDLRGKWVKVTFDAKIKDEYKSIESLKQRSVDNNGNVLTEEIHTGVPNEALMTIRIKDDGKYEIKTNTVTVIPPTPEIKTTLTADNFKTVSKGLVYEMVDTVEYKNLEIGWNYIMSGYLVNDKGEALDVESVTVEFTPKARDGSVELTFTVDTSVVPDEHIVAFETLYVVGDIDKDTEPTDENPTPTKDTPVAEHKDPKDPSQTVTVKTVEIGTVAKFDNGSKTIKPGESNKVIDTIKFSGLTPGRKYVAYAQMMDKSGKGVSLRTRYEFTVLSEDGEVEVPIAFTTERLQGKYVAFEEVYEISTKDGEDIERFVAEHKDLDDKAQTVTITPGQPDTGTSLPFIAIGLGLVAIIGLVFLFFKKKK